MNCQDCDTTVTARLAKGCPPEGQGYAIFDTGSDQFVTSCWPYRMCERILGMWERKGRNLARFEIRPRDYGEATPNNRAVLLVGKADNIIHAFFHWDNRKYALAYNETEVFPVIYTPPNGQDITDIMKRFDNKLWDGKGKKITFAELKTDFNPTPAHPSKPLPI